MEAKKVDLLSFQKNLNQQFIDIFENKKSGITQSEESIELGLQAEAGNFKFFLALKDLQNISINNSYEESKLLASWICGFNQIRGEVFTIMDFKKTIDYLLNKNQSNQYKKLVGEDRIVYIKEYESEKIGFILDNIDLVQTSRLTQLFKHKENEEKKYWVLGEEVTFDSFVDESNMSKEEFDILKALLDKKVVKKYSEETINEIFFYLVDDIYLDVLGKRPIFVLNAENLTKVLINISPLQ